MAIKPIITEPRIVGLEPVKKKPLKEKRKRKKSSGRECKGGLTMERNAIPSTMFSSLPVYDEIRNQTGLTDYALYKLFAQYLMTASELESNDYPIESPDRKGHILPKPLKYSLDPSEDPSTRVCCRCYTKFVATIEDDYYYSDSTCRYHNGKMYLGMYNCCNRPINSAGCKWADFHVTSETIWDDIVFRRIDGKRQVKNEQSCKVYSLDCEMVYTTNGLEVAKVGLVDIEGKPVYVSYVQPEHRILDYNTQYSGVTAKDLKDVVITLADVQSFLLKTLNRGTILVGHALQNDLRHLRLLHERVVDTQVVYGCGYRAKLKNLASTYLNKTIHESMFGHDPVEDARVCMELMLFRIKLDNFSDMKDYVDATQSLHSMKDYMDDTRSLHSTKSYMEPIKENMWLFSRRNMEPVPKIEIRSPCAARNCPIHSMKDYMDDTRSLHSTKSYMEPIKENMWLFSRRNIEPLPKTEIRSPFAERNCPCREKRRLKGLRFEGCHHRPAVRIEPPPEDYHEQGHYPGRARAAE